MAGSGILLFMKRPTRAVSDASNCSGYPPAQVHKCRQNSVLFRRTAIAIVGRETKTMRPRANSTTSCTCSNFKFIGSTEIYDTVSRRDLVSCIPHTHTSSIFALCKRQEEDLGAFLGDYVQSPLMTASQWHKIFKNGPWCHHPAAEGHTVTQRSENGLWCHHCAVEGLEITQKTRKWPIVSPLYCGRHCGDKTDQKMAQGVTIMLRKASLWHNRPENGP